MDLRRALLLLAVVMLVLVGASSLGPPPETADEAEPPAAPAPRSGAADASGEAIEIELHAGNRSGDDPAAETVEAGSHVIVTVRAEEPGQAELEGLGRVAAVEPGTPAVFDLLPTRTGRFKAVVTAVDGTERRAGTIAVN